MLCLSVASSSGVNPSAFVGACPPALLLPPPADRPPTFPVIFIWGITYFILFLYLGINLDKNLSFDLPINFSSIDIIGVIFSNLSSATLNVSEPGGYLASIHNAQSIYASGSLKTSLGSLLRS